SYSSSRRFHLSAPLIHLLVRFHALERTAVRATHRTGLATVRSPCSCESAAAAAQSRRSSRQLGKNIVSRTAMRTRSRRFGCRLRACRQVTGGSRQTARLSTLIESERVASAFQNHAGKGTFW